MVLMRHVLACTQVAVIELVKRKRKNCYVNYIMLFYIIHIVSLRSDFTNTKTA